MDASRHCFLQFAATADEANFLLSWIVEKTTRTGQRCDLQISEEPLLIEDLESGQRMTIRTFRRMFSPISPVLDVDVTDAVDMAAPFPGFAEVPAAERRYTLALHLRREFTGRLPEQVTIQLPALQVGGRSIQPPPLVLQRRDVPSSSIRAYLPTTYKEIPRTVALREFGIMPGAASSRGPLGMVVSPGVYVWHAHEGLITLAAGFMGRDDDKWSDDDKRSGGTGNPFIDGDIYVHILSGDRVRLQDGQVFWQQTPGDEVPVVVHFEPSRWLLTQYTTASYAALPERRFGASYVRPMKPYEDTTAQFLVSIPHFQPKRIRVTLPPVTVDGREWPIMPIEFEYRAGGVGLEVWP